MTATFTTHYHTDKQPEGRLDSNEPLPAHREPENMRTEFMGEYSLLQSPEVDVWHIMTLLFTPYFMFNSLSRGQSAIETMKMYS